MIQVYSHKDEYGNEIVIRMTDMSASIGWESDMTSGNATWNNVDIRIGIEYTDRGRDNSTIENIQEEELFPDSSISMAVRQVRSLQKYIETVSYEELVALALVAVIETMKRDELSKNDLRNVFMNMAES